MSPTSSPTVWSSLQCGVSSAAERSRSRSSTQLPPCTASSSRACGWHWPSSCRRSPGTRSAWPHVRGSFVSLKRPPRRSACASCAVPPPPTASPTPTRSNRSSRRAASSCARCATSGAFTRTSRVSPTQFCIDPAPEAGAPPRVAWSRLVRSVRQPCRFQLSQSARALRRTTWDELQPARGGTTARLLGLQTHRPQERCNTPRHAPSAVSRLISLLVFVVPPPPFIRRRLRPASGRVFPGLLPAERRQVQKRIETTQQLIATSTGKIRVEYLFAVAQKDAGAGGLASRGRYAEVHVEVTGGGGKPRQCPPHAFFIRKNVLQGGPGDQHQRGVTRVKMAKGADVVGVPRTPDTTRVGPAVNARRKHEVLQNKLAATVEQLAETGLTSFALEDVGLVDSHHRQAPTLGRERVPRARSGLFLYEQSLTGGLPLRARHNGRKVSGCHDRLPSQRVLPLMMS